MSKRLRHRKRDLSKQQLGLVKLVAEGLTNREIARTIGITEQVVEGHLHVIQEKLGLSHRVELIFWHRAHKPDIRG
jgi:DNA-binding NarL/FixJ family response regulator